MNHKKLMKLNVIEPCFLKFILFVILFKKFELSGSKKILHSFQSDQKKLTMLS